jgi:hypothetical protein
MVESKRKLWVAEEDAGFQSSTGAGITILWVIRSSRGAKHHRVEQDYPGKLLCAGNSELSAAAES